MLPALWCQDAVNKLYIIAGSIIDKLQEQGTEQP